MSRTKVQLTEPDPPLRYKPVDAFKGTDPPEWNDVQRGLLVALIENNKGMWNIAFSNAKDKIPQYKLAKEKVLDLMAGEIAVVLQGSDERLNAWALLEKWCWMCEMYCRAVEFRFNWRYINSMNFLTTAPPSGGASIYLGSLSNERFIELTMRYGTTPEEQSATGYILPKKSRRFSTGHNLFKPEMQLYAELVNQPTPMALAVSTSNGINPVQVIASPSTVFTQSSPIAAKVVLAKNRRAKINSKTRGNGIELQPTSLAEVLTTMPVPITSIAPVINSEIPSTSTAGEKDNDKKPEELNKELIIALIESVNARPEINDPEVELTSHRLALWQEVADGLQQLPYGNNINATQAFEAWRELRKLINRPQCKMAGDFEKLEKDVYSLLKASAMKTENMENQSNNSSFKLAGWNGKDVQAQLNNFLKMIPQNEKGHNDTKRRSSGKLHEPSPKRTCPADVRQCPSPQIVTTWVPPKEENFTNVFTTIPSTHPTATAQIMSTSSSLPLSGLFSDSIKDIKKPQINGIGKRASAHFDSKNEQKEDKWNLLGRLIEQTCRELEAKDYETAVHLQRELSEVLCRFQLQSLKKT